MWLLFDVAIPTFVISMCVGAMLLLAACSTTGDSKRSLDLAVTGSYTQGSQAGTRNQNPQGGTDEKSDSTPAESTK